MRRRSYDFVVSVSGYSETVRSISQKSIPLDRASDVSWPDLTCMILGSRKGRGTCVFEDFPMRSRSACARPKVDISQLAVDPGDDRLHGHETVSSHSDAMQGNFWQRESGGFLHFFRFFTPCWLVQNIFLEKGFLAFFRLKNALSYHLPGPHTLSDCNTIHLSILGPSWAVL